MKVGDKVLYVPGHANGDMLHRDCEEGTVSSIGPLIFVKFGKSIKSCHPRDLVINPGARTQTT